MIIKQFRVLIIITVIVVLATAALFLLQDKKETPTNQEPNLISNRDFLDVARIRVVNKQDSMIVVQENGGFYMEEVPSEIINPEYLQQIVADSAYIEYEQRIEDVNNLSDFGLDDPESVVEITYSNNESLTLLLGNEGPISNTRYVYNENDENVYLFKKAATIRFIMSKNDFVNYVIVPPHEVQDVLSTISYVKYDGKLLERPIVIEKVDTTNENQVAQASSFGVASHLMVDPTLQKVDLREANLQFSALVGLLNHGIVAYNATDSQLEQVGLLDPDLVIDFDFSPDAQREAQRYNLKVSTIDNQSYVMVNNNRVIHKIEEEAFLNIAYENIISRWFFTPLLLDVENLIVRFDNQEHLFSIEKLGDNQINVLKNGVEVDSDAFRKFYNLVVSASHDGEYLPFTPATSYLLEIEFDYIEKNKENDVVVYYDGGIRRNSVCFNDTCDFAIKDTYVDFVKNAVSLLESNSEFPINWE